MTDHLKLTSKAPAKINLGLHVLQKRLDGFHDLETVFLQTGWADEVSVSPAETLFMTCSDPNLPTDEGNLCMKAAISLQKALNTSPLDKSKGAHIHLEKIVPYGAGLGGGSSDAAFTLKLLNQLWNANCSDDFLRDIAVGLGSDVPFFIDGRPAYATGRGEVLSLIEDYHFPFTLVIAMPKGVHVSTPEAYGMITPNNQNRVDLVELIRSNDLAKWQNSLINDFEKPISNKFPQITDLKKQFLTLGSGFAMMSGSGAAVFGIFEDKNLAEEAKTVIHETGLQVWCGKSS